MSASTIGRIKGRILHEEILNFIRQKYDPNAKDFVRRNYLKPISDINWKFTINEHSDDKKEWYSDIGFINFIINGNNRNLFYKYENINNLENMDYYNNLGLKEMVEAETTYISLGYNEEGVKIIREIIAHFGGGWIDDNDCDTESYVPISINEDGSIAPIIRITREELNKKFGGVVVITDYYL